MNVLLVILHANPARGGAESYCVHLFRSLRARGVDARIAAATFDPSIEPAHRVQLPLKGMTRSGKYRGFLDALDSHLKKSSHDIVHAMLPVRRCDIYHPQAGVESVSLAGLPKFKQLTGGRRVLFAQIERTLLEHKRPPVVLCMSERSRQQTQTAFLIDTTRLITLYNGVESDRFVPTDAPAESPARLVMVGHDFARKGADLAIRAVAHVPEVVLDIVGKDDPAIYITLAKELGVADRVRFLGVRRNVEKLFSGAIALIHPARFEPFGMVVPEAMLMGLPPIVSKASGASEIVRDTVDGRVVEADDGFAGAIREVLAKHAAMRAACLTRRTELSYKTHLDKLLDIYEHIIDARR